MGLHSSVRNLVPEELDLVSEELDFFSLGKFFGHNIFGVKFIVTFWQITVPKSSLKKPKTGGPQGKKIFLVPSIFLICCF